MERFRVLPSGVSALANNVSLNRILPDGIHWGLHQVRRAAGLMTDFMKHHAQTIMERFANHDPNIENLSGSCFARVSRDYGKTVFA
jgi:hypothetical protein